MTFSDRMLEVIRSRGLLAFEIFADLIVTALALLAIWIFERWFSVLEGKENTVLLGFIPLRYPFDAAHIAVILRLAYRSWKDISR